MIELIAQSTMIFLEILMVLYLYNKLTEK